MNSLFDASPAVLKGLPLHQVRTDPDQPRKAFDPDALSELAASIKVIGLLQPILVREEHEGLYTILVGERRWRAAGLAGLTTMPCRVLSMHIEKLTQRVMQCSANAHHQELIPLEYVDAISEMLMAGLGTSAIAEALGKRVDWVRGHELAANPSYRTLFETGRLRGVDVLAHFRALPDPARRELLDSDTPITSTRCAQLRQKYRERDEREAALRQPGLPLMELADESRAATLPQVGEQAQLIPARERVETGAHDLDTGGGGCRGYSTSCPGGPGPESYFGMASGMRPEVTMETLYADLDQNDLRNVAGCCSLSIEDVRQEARLLCWSIASGQCDFDPAPGTPRQYVMGRLWGITLRYQVSVRLGCSGHEVETGRRTS